MKLDPGRHLFVKRRSALLTEVVEVPMDNVKHHSLSLLANVPEYRRVVEEKVFAGGDRGRHGARPGIGFIWASR